MTYKEALENIKRSTIQITSSSAPIVNSAANKKENPNTESANKNSDTPPPPAARHASPHIPGTLLRISVPAGTTVNILNLLEIMSPKGISIVVRLPLLSGLTPHGLKPPTLQSIVDAIKAVGGTVELLG